MGGGGGGGWRLLETIIDYVKKKFKKKIIEMSVSERKRDIRKRTEAFLQRTGFSSFEGPPPPPPPPPHAPFLNYHGFW